MSGSVSDGSRCQTRLNSQGCGVPSYHWCVPGTPSYTNVFPTGSHVWPPSVQRLVRGADPALPRLAPVVGALDLLPEPAAGLRRIQPMRVSGRALEVVDLPPAKVGATDTPPCALGVRRQN